MAFMLIRKNCFEHTKLNWKESNLHIRNSQQFFLTFKSKLLFLSPQVQMNGWQWQNVARFSWDEELTILIDARVILEVPEVVDVLPGWRHNPLAPVLQQVVQEEERLVGSSPIGSRVLKNKFRLAFRLPLKKLLMYVTIFN